MKQRDYFFLIIQIISFDLIFFKPSKKKKKKKRNYNIMTLSFGIGSDIDVPALNNADIQDLGDDKFL